MANELLYDGVLYDALRGGYESELEFWITEANKSEGDVLELCCGTGRVAIPIAESGKNVTGIDISDSMLEQGKKKASEKNLKIEWIKSDIREFDLGKKFGMIYIPFNSILHLHKTSDIEQLFSNVKRHLTKDGRFYISIFNPNLQVLSRDPNTRFFHAKFVNPETGKSITIEESPNYDNKTQINNITLYFEFEDGYEKTESLSIRILYPQEIDMLLHYNGFKIESKFGDYKRNQFESDSGLQIFELSLR